MRTGDQIDFSQLILAGGYGATKPSETRGVRFGV